MDDELELELGGGGDHSSNDAGAMHPSCLCFYFTRAAHHGWLVPSRGGHSVFHLGLTFGRWTVEHTRLCQ